MLDTATIDLGLETQENRMQSGANNLYTNQLNDLLPLIMLHRQFTEPALQFAA